MNKTWGEIQNDVLNLGFKQSKSSGRDKENYISAYIEFSITSNADSFISGFRLGAKFIYDTFVKNTKG